MGATRFDTLAKLFADRRSRRAAQGATPPAAPGDKTMFLFVQSFYSGRIEPKVGENGTYTLTLEEGQGQTIYFSDRPERIVGAAPTPRFLDGLGFSPDNPPNAALVAETADGQTEVAVVELYSPAYDEATGTATYEVTVLAAWEDALGVGLTQTPADLAALGSEFGAAHLFIDDCPDQDVWCVDRFGDWVGDLGPQGTCWSWCDWQCHWCRAPGSFVDDCGQFASKCSGANCGAAWNGTTTGAPDC